MSSQTVRSILQRAVSDDKFLQAMLNQPQNALTEYADTLTDEEKQALQTGAPRLLRFASATSHEADFLPDIPYIWPLQLAYLERVEASVYEQLEKLAKERIQGATGTLTDVSTSLEALKEMDSPELEQYVIETLRKWEKPNVG